MTFNIYLITLSEIKNMCDKKLTCEGCLLYNKECCRCKLAFTVPRHWEVE